MDVSQSSLTPRQIIGSIDHSLLNPTATRQDLHNLCKVAAELQVASVCLLPYAVADATRLLRGTSVLVSTVVAFPHGATSCQAKALESRVALGAGAQELDVVVNVSAVLSGEFALVEDELGELTELCHAGGARIKVIFENCYLNREQKLKLCELSTAAGADWVKTSTGFGQPIAGPAGATAEDITLMRQSCPPRVAIKASGGIRTLAQAREFLGLGASRIGTSQTEAIARELGLLPRL